MPHYRDAAYGGETVTLANDHLRLEVHKRVTGWGWGELFVPGPFGQPDRFFAVLEHLAEAHVEGMPYTMRLEAADYQLQETDEGQTLTFAVQLQAVEPPDATYEGAPSPLKGSVILSLGRDDTTLGYHLELESQQLIHLYRLRGPWLRVGADSFGTDRHDAIFPGIEWLRGDEWSSGTDWFEHPQALRLTPHPHKVSIPLMAISHDGIGLGLSWNPHQAALSAGTRLRCPQPVFASPNFVDRRPHHLLGVMWPSARWGMEENALSADPPIQIRKGLKLVLDAEISVVAPAEGAADSLDVVVDWVKRHGMPDPGAPRYSWEDALERIAAAYNSNLWVEGQGWGHSGKGSPHVPQFVTWYAEHGANQKISQGLREKIAWAGRQVIEDRDTYPRRLAWPTNWIASQPERAQEIGEALLAIQTPEGDFPYDPKERHHTMLQEWAEFWRPLGQPGDSALDLCVTAATALLIAGRKTGDERFLKAARETFDFALQWDRPEGGDWWETPLNSPNLLAAGNAAVGYELAYRHYGDARYRRKAIHWIRSLLPFTHLWQPLDVTMLYNTKPCLNSTCWYLSDWVSKHVEWEVLMTFSNSDAHGIDWAEVDPELDWTRYHQGVTTAAIRWMVDHKDPAWVFASEYAPGLVEDGAWDTLYPDTFDPVHGTYGGGPISPEAIANNVLILLKRRG